MMAENADKQSGHKRIALVGHCGPDSFMLRSAASRAAPGAEVESIESEKELKGRIEELDLLLVNRVLDGSFPGDSGIELIRRVRASHGQVGPAMILVSNFAEAQEEAEAAGARPGFGKQDLYRKEAGERIREALG